MINQFTDSAIVSFGKTVEEAFLNGAIEVLERASKLAKGNGDVKLEIQVKAPSLEQLFLEWITTILEKSESEKIDLTKITIKIGKFGSNFFLHGYAFGKKSKTEINNLNSIKMLGNATAEIDEGDGQIALRFFGNF